MAFTSKQPHPAGGSQRLWLHALCLLAVACAVHAAPASPQEPDHQARLNHPLVVVHDDSDTPRFTAAFSTSVLMIVATEMGDKTFFIAAIMAMRHSRSHVLLGSLSALFLMTLLSAALGKTFPMLFDKRHTSILAAFLFTYFGVQLLWEFWKHRGKEDAENPELHQVEESLRGDVTVDEKPYKSSLKPDWMPRLLSRPSFIPETLIRAFVLTFLAEWGDRSQIATIALAAAKDVFGVAVGAVLGHTICTSIAVVGGRMLAARISERIVNLIGGLLFLLFAALTLTRGASIR